MNGAFSQNLAQSASSPRSTGVRPAIGAGLLFVGGNMKIKGGYYIKARKIQESEIAHWPPHVREIWDWLLQDANWEDGKKLKRGQTRRTINEIREALHWKVGYRKERYSATQCENAMKLLRKAGMIATTKTGRGTIITICNYEEYQNPENYECRNECRNECREAAERKQKKKEEERKKPPIVPLSKIKIPPELNSPKFRHEWIEWKNYKKEEHSFKFKSPKSEQAALTQLKNLSNGDVVVAVKIIEQSMSNGWKGLFALKQNGTHTSTRRETKHGAIGRGRYDKDPEIIEM